MKIVIFSILCCYFVIHTTFGAKIQASGLLRAEEFDCPTKVRLVENECNPCYCTKDGELACTINECPKNKGRGLEDCTLSTSWKKGCNKCWCITIGQVCTDKACDS